MSLPGRPRGFPAILAASVIAGVGGFVGCAADEFLSIGPSGLAAMGILWAALYGVPTVFRASVRDASAWKNDPAAIARLRRAAVAAFALVLVTAFATLVWQSRRLTLSVYFRCGTGLVPLILMFPFLLSGIGAIGAVLGHGLARASWVGRSMAYALLTSGAAVFAVAALRSPGRPSASEYVSSLPIVARVHTKGSSAADLAKSVGVDRCDGECIDWMAGFSGRGGDPDRSITVRRDARHDFTILETQTGSYAFTPVPFREREIDASDVADSLGTSPWVLVVAFSGLCLAFGLTAVARRLRRELRSVASAWEGRCERRWVAVQTGALYPLPRARPIPDGPVLVEVRLADDRGVPYRTATPPLVRVWQGTRSEVQAYLGAGSTAFYAAACLAIAITCAPLFAPVLRSVMR